MKLLALELSSAIGSIALQHGDELRVRSIATPREQTERTLAVIDELLKAAGIALTDLDALVFGRGPGSFTGLRVAAAHAQGLALVAGVPLVPVSSLLALAQAAYRVGGARRSLVCVDARMREIYCGSFTIEAGVAVAAAPERLLAPAAIEPLSGSSWAAVGDAFSSYRIELAATAAAAADTFASLTPSAADLLPRAIVDVRAGVAVAPAAALPTYLRDSAAWRRVSNAGP